MSCKLHLYSYRGHSHLQGHQSTLHTSNAKLTSHGNFTANILCWWDLIRSEQLFSVSVCCMEMFARFSGHSNSIHTIIPLLRKKRKWKYVVVNCMWLLLYLFSIRKVHFSFCYPINKYINRCKLLTYELWFRQKIQNNYSFWLAGYFKTRPDFYPLLTSYFLEQNTPEQYTTYNILILFAYIPYLTLVKGDPMAPFSIATTLKCRRGHNSIPRIAPLYPWFVHYNAEC